MSMLYNDFEFVDDYASFLDTASKMMFSIMKQNAEKQAELERQVRESYRYKLVKYEPSAEFNKRYRDHRNNYYILTYDGKPMFDNVTYGNANYPVLFTGSMFNSIDECEKKLNTERFVIMSKTYDDKFSDSIMTSCHGKDWKKNKVSPYRIETYIVIFDTLKGEVIFETSKECLNDAYIDIFNNVAKISQERHSKIYFDMLHHNIILESNDDMIETNNHLIVGKSRYHGKTDNKIAYLIDTNTGEMTNID